VATQTFTFLFTDIEGSTAMAERLGNAWSGVLAPAGTPADVVAKLNAAIDEGLTSREGQASLMKLSALSKPGTPQDFASFIAAQSPIWAELVRLSGASIE